MSRVIFINQIIFPRKKIESINQLSFKINFDFIRTIKNQVHIFVIDKLIKY